jgi:hypothetical protein
MFTSPLFSGTGRLQVVTYMIPPIVGDYNVDGKVDAADYIVWRNRVGDMDIPNRDPNNSGSIGSADYISWRTKFGTMVGSGAGQNLPPNGGAVPEPSLWGMLLSAIAGQRFRRSKTWQN